MTTDERRPARVGGRREVAFFVVAVRHDGSRLVLAEAHDEAQAARLLAKFARCEGYSEVLVEEAWRG